MESPREEASGQGESRGRQRQTTQANYDDVRDQIKDGDILLWSGSYLGSRFFRCLTNSRYSHAAIAAKWGDRLLVLQSEWVGIQAVPLSRTVWSYNGLVDWYSLKEEYRGKLALEQLLSEARSDLGLKFGTMGVLRSTWNRIMRGVGIVERRLRRGPRRRLSHLGAMFCSQYVAHCFNKGGLPLIDREENDTLPGDIAASDKLELKATLRNVRWRHDVKTGRIPAPTGPIPRNL